MIKSIRCFEYSTLQVDNNLFKRHHFNSLVKWNDKNGNKYFSVGYNKIKFCQYVGIIQVDSLLIEILPKVDSDNTTNQNEILWFNVLLQMLKFSRYNNINSFKEADLKLKYSTLLDFYIDLFLSECELIIKRGLIKKYRTVQDNTQFLKGKIILNQHIKLNAIHKERFFNEFSNYDYNNIYNQILFKALSILKELDGFQYFNDRVNKLYLLFSEISDLKNFTRSDFDRLKFERTTDSYINAIQLAKLIILNYTPDISRGDENILSILFDMNDLYEKFVARLLSVYSDYDIETQRSRKFWENKSIRPDIILKDNKMNYIIDTKWKKPIDNIPSDADLKQMFVYNEYFESNNAILLYPTTKYTEGKSGQYKINDKICQSAYMRLVFKDNNLNLKETAIKLNETLKESL